MAFTNFLYATLLGGKRYDINNNRFASLIISSPSDDTTGNVLGLEVMSLSCDYTLFEGLRNLRFPVDCQLSISQRSGAKGKITLFCHQVTPVDKLPPSE